MRRVGGIVSRKWVCQELSFTRVVEGMSGRQKIFSRSSSAVSMGCKQVSAERTARDGKNRRFFPLRGEPQVGIVPPVHLKTGCAFLQGFSGKGAAYAATFRCRVYNASVCLHAIPKRGDRGG